MWGWWQKGRVCCGCVVMERDWGGAEPLAGEVCALRLGFGRGCGWSLTGEAKGGSEGGLAVGEVGDAEADGAGEGTGEG